MNKIIKEIKELSSFYKVVAALLLFTALVLVVPLFIGGDYLNGLLGWIDFAFWGFLSALLIGCWIGKCVEESKNEG